MGIEKIFILLAIAAIILLYTWIVWTARTNGRSAIVWLVLSFFISPWLVALLLAIAGESNTQKELRELREHVSPSDAELIEIKRDRDNLRRHMIGIATIILHVIVLMMLFH